MDQCQFIATAVLKHTKMPAQVQAQPTPLLLKLNLSSAQPWFVPRSARCFSGQSQGCSASDKISAFHLVCLKLCCTPCHSKTASHHQDQSAFPTQQCGMSQDEQYYRNSTQQWVYSDSIEMLKLKIWNTNPLKFPMLPEGFGNRFPLQNIPYG